MIKLFLVNQYNSITFEARKGFIKLRLIFFDDFNIQKIAELFFIPLKLIIHPLSFDWPSFDNSSLILLSRLEIKIARLKSTSESRCNFPLRFPKRDPNFLVSKVASTS